SPWRRVGRRVTGSHATSSPSGTRPRWAPRCRPGSSRPGRVTSMEDAVIVSAVRTPVGTFGGAFVDVPATKLGATAVAEAQLRDGLWCAFDDCHMGSTAENIAREYEVSREDQDAFAAASQQKAETAITSGRFKDEIVGVRVQKRKDEVLVETDEHPRVGTTVE